MPHARFRSVGLFVSVMPKGLKRIYGFGHLHFITFRCYRRMLLLRAHTPSMGHPQRLTAQTRATRPEMGDSERQFARLPGTRHRDAESAEGGPSAPLRTSRYKTVELVLCCGNIAQISRTSGARQPIT